MDRPVVDRTRLTGRDDFDLSWAPDPSQLAARWRTAKSLPLFEAIREQLGLRLEATRRGVQSL